MCTMCWRQNPWCTWPRKSKRVCCCVACFEVRVLGVSDQDYPSVLAAVCWRQSPWCIWPRLSERLCCCVVCVGGRALVLSGQDYSSMCADVYWVGVAESLVYLTKFIQACVLLCSVCWRQSPWCIRTRSKSMCNFEAFDGGRTLGVSDKDYPSMCAVV